MIDLKESIVESLDGSGLDIFPYLPFLLQDLREIGTDPITVSELLNDHVDDFLPLKILDLGCGKGAVSIRLAKDYNCLVFGIDALPEFVESAKEFAIGMGVYHKCIFTQGDIRNEYQYYKDFDVVILGAIGPVLGNIQETLTKVSGCLKEGGIVVLDDGYVPDDSSFTHDKCTTRTEFINQIHGAGFEIVTERVFDSNEMEEQNRFIFSAIKSRTQELISNYPEKESLLNEYLRFQETENYALEKKLVCGVWLLEKI